jgi:DNA-binding SARP family transcriptional activator
MRLSSVPARGEPFRPFFWVDDRFRVLDWPEATAGALRRPARAAMGRPCWEVIAGNAHTPPATCRQCQLPRCRALAAAPGRFPPPAARTGGCAVLPLPGPARETLVWLPFSSMVPGPAASVRLESLVIRGALAGRLHSIEDTLDGLRRACGADDCELFMLDPAAKEVILVDCEGADRDAFLERTRMPLGIGYPGTITLQQKPRFTNRFQQDELFLRTSVKQRGIHSFLGVPLLAAGQPLGYLGLGWRNAAVPMAWALRVVDDLRTLVTVALHDRPLPLARDAQVDPPLAIRCLGTFEIAQHGRVIEPGAFGRRKALELLKILVLQRGAPLHRDQLAELLWPGVVARSAANRLHGIVNALRSTLERQRHRRSSQYILCRDDHYLFNMQAPHSIDVHQFVDLLAAARSARRQGAEQQALGAYEQAIALYRGDLYADSADDETFEPQRMRLRHSYLDAVRAVAGAKLRAHQDEEALAALRQALALEPVALDLQELLITRLAQIGRMVEARQQYQSCRRALRRHLDMELPARMRALEQLLY